MRRKSIKFITGFVACLLIIASLTGCGSKTTTTENSMKSVEELSELATFDDFRFLMFTDAEGNTIVRDSDGVMATQTEEGEFYDKSGNKIETWGAGDTKTLNNPNSGYSPRGTVDKMRNQDDTPDDDESGDVAANNDVSPTPEEVIPPTEDEVEWGDLLNELGPIENPDYGTGATWHGKSTENNSYSPGSGKKFATTGSSVLINCNVGADVPLLVKFNSVAHSGNNINITIDVSTNLTEYDTYMKNLYGDTVINSEGVEVPANYLDTILQTPIEFQLVSEFGLNGNRSTAQSILLNAEGKASASLTVSKVEAGVNYIYISGAAIQIS